MRDELPLQPQVSLQPFEKWAIDFVGPIQPPGKRIGACYIITATKYITKWAEAETVNDCIRATTTNFLFEYVLTRFGWSKVLMSDRGMHFLNEMMSALIEEFQDVRIPAVPWAYRTACKNMTGQTLFRLVYGVEVVMPMEYIVPSLHIVALIGMADHEALEEWLMQLMELEEDRFLAGFHQQVQKEREKARHDCHIKLRTFKVNDIVLLYDSKFTKF
eukprot:PITA_23008